MLLARRQRALPSASCRVRVHTTAALPREHQARGTLVLPSAPHERQSARWPRAAAAEPLAHAQASFVALHVVATAAKLRRMKSTLSTQKRPGEWGHLPATDDALVWASVTCMSAVCVDTPLALPHTLTRATTERACGYQHAHRQGGGGVPVPRHAFAASRCTDSSSPTLA